MSNSEAQTEMGQDAAILECHKKFLGSKGFNPILSSLNKQSILRFESLGIPHGKHEMFTFVDTKGLIQIVSQGRRERMGTVSEDIINRNIYPGCEKSIIVIVDGFYVKSLSNIRGAGNSVHVMNIEKAVSDININRYLLNIAERESDVFSSINGAFFTGGIMIDIANDTNLSTPLQILHISTSPLEEPAMTTPRIVLRAGNSSSVSVIVKYIGTAGDYLVNSTMDVMLEDGAILKLWQVQADSPKAWHLSKTHVQMSRMSKLETVLAYSGCKIARSNFEVHLSGEGAELTLNGISVLCKNEQAHSYIRVYHEAPGCISNQLFRNIVNGRARASVDGTVIVREGAQLTCSEQLINNLVLSDDARADTKPNLMIYNDNVKCTHGSTAGSLDEDQIFYLRTRNFTEVSARALLTASFAKKVINSIDYPPVAEEVRDILLKKLET
jgi:Fe-S cluster assembly protein SufD